MVDKVTEKEVLPLYYWDTKGTAEMTRVLLTYFKQPFKDFPTKPTTKEDWIKKELDFP